MEEVKVTKIKADALQAPADNLVNRRTEKDISVSELAGKTLDALKDVFQVRE